MGVRVGVGGLDRRMLRVSRESVFVCLFVFCLFVCFARVEWCVCVCVCACVCECVRV